MFARPAVLGVGIKNDGVDVLGRQKDLVVALVHQEPDIRDDHAAVLPGRLGNLVTLADHGAVLNVDVAFSIGGGRVEDSDVDGGAGVLEVSVHDFNILRVIPDHRRTPADARVDEGPSARIGDNEILTPAHGIEDQRESPLGNALEFKGALVREAQHRLEGFDVTGKETGTEPFDA